MRLVSHGGRDFGRDGGHVDEGLELRAEQRERQQAVRLQDAERVPWQIRKFRVVRILDHHEAAGLANRDESCHPVLEHPGHQHADHVRTVLCRRGAKQLVDRRARMILACTTPEHEVLAAEQQMIIRRRQVDVAALHALALLGPRDRQRRRAAQDLDEVRRVRRRHVLDDADRRSESRRERLEQARERLDSSGGATDHDQLTRTRTLRARRPEGAACSVSHWHRRSFSRLPACTPARQLLVTADSERCFVLQSSQASSRADLHNVLFRATSD